MKKTVAIFIACIFALSILLVCPVTAAAGGSIGGGGSGSSKPKITSIKMPSSIAYNASASISFKVNKKCSASVQIYDAKNKLVVKLKAKTVQKNKAAAFKWNGKNSKNKYVAAGKYKIRLIAGKTTVNKNMTVNKPVPKIINVNIPASFNIGQENLKMSYKVDMACSAWSEVYKDDGVSLIYSTAKTTLQKGQTASCAWDGVFREDAVHDINYYPSGSYWVVLHAGSTVYKKKIQAICPSEGNIGKFYVKILNAQRILDDAGYPSVRIYYSVKNNYDGPAHSYVVVGAYQKEAIDGSTPNTKIPEDSNAWEVLVNPGDTITCASSFRLKDNSPVLVAIWNYHEAMLQKTFTLK